MRPGLKTSLIVHAIIFIMLFAGLPVFKNKRNYEEQVVTVEVLPVSEITNVKPKQAKPKTDPKQEVAAKNAPKISIPEPKVKPQDVVKVEPLPKPTVKPEVKPEVKKEALKVKPEEKPAPKVEEKKPEQKKPEETKKPEKAKEAVDDFASVIKSVEEGQKKADEKEKNAKTDADFSKAAEDVLSNASEAQYKEGVPMSVSDKDAIRQQIMKNWTVTSGAKDIQNTVITLHINLQQDGTVSKVEVRNESSYKTPAMRAMVDSAVRAVYKSSPLQNLPAEKYDVKDGWREFELNFDPREMVF